MKFTANREELLSAAQDALSVAPDKSPLKELECAYLATEDGKLTVAGGNLQVALERRIPVQIEEEGVVIIDAQMLVDMLRRLADERVAISVDANRYMEVTCGEAYYGVSTLDSAKYPRLDIPFPEDTVPVTGIPNLTRRTVFAVSETNDKPALKCVHLIFSDEGLRAISSDGYRVATAKGDTKSTASVDMLIPADSLGRLARLISNKDELRVGMTGNTVVFMKEDFIFSARLVQGSYFDEKQMLSRVQAAFMVLTDAQALRSAMTSAYAVTGEQNRFSLTFQGARLRMSCEEQLFGRIDLTSIIPGAVPEAYLKGDAVYQDMKDSLTCRLSEFAQHPDSEERRTLVDEAVAKIESYRKAAAVLHSTEPMVNTSGKLPEADICFLDEIFKCNDGVLNSLLTALNERKYTNEGRTYDIPTISFFAASNEIPNFNDPQEKILAALYDRLELKVVTANIADRGKRLAVLRDKQAGHFGAVGATTTLDELRAMQEEVAAIPVPEAVNELADDILCELRKEVPVSDRKYLNFYPIAQAKAWLSGHAEVMPVDLLALKNYLWYKPADIPMIEATLTRMCVNPMQDKVNDIRAVAKEIIDELNASADAGVEPRKAFRKFRTEIVRVYGLYADLAAKAQSDGEKAMLAGLLSDLENESRIAHEKYGYTYTPLRELAEL